MHPTPFIMMILLAPSPAAVAAEPTTIAFPAADELPVTADLYIAHEDKQAPFIVLFHQARWSRGEYAEIAPKLNKLGFNCMAVDQRSGGEVNGVINQTNAGAEKAGKSTDYLDALADLEAALRYARAHHADGKLIAWGSSYSAALVLKLAGDQPALMDGVLAFAPGEYFKRQGKPTDWIEQSARKIEMPAFITSAREERKAWMPIFRAIPAQTKASYLPRSKGNHGSRALWDRFKDSAGYWRAVTAFLQEHFPPRQQE